MSDSDSSSSDESDNDYDSQSTRKFELARMIDSHFGGESSQNLSSQWSFVLDDGMFERQANFCTTMDLWRHLQQIDTSLTKLRTRSKKGVVRLFKSEFAHHAKSSAKNLWQSDTSMKNGGKWVIRFSRKFPFNISDLWVNVVLSVVSESVPRAAQLAGCVFTTRKGKTEIEIWMQEDITGAPSAKGKGVQAMSEEHQELKIRELLDLKPTEKTIQIQFKTHCRDRQKKLDLERVRKVQERRNKKGGANTWSHREKEEPAAQMDEQKKLAEYKQQVAADPYELGSQQSHYQYDYSEETPVQPYKYNYDDDEEEEEAKPPLSALLTPPSSMLNMQVNVEGEVHVDVAGQQAPEPAPKVVLPPLPTLPLAELQQMQLQDLKIQSESEESDEEEEDKNPLNLALLRTRLDSGDAAVPTTSMLTFWPESVEPVKKEAAKPIAIPAPMNVDPDFEHRQLYGDSDTEHTHPHTPNTPNSNPLALFEAEPSMVARKPTVAGFKSFSPPTKYAMVLGTNPPDFSSPLMKAVLWPSPRRPSW